MKCVRDFFSSYGTLATLRLPYSTVCHHPIVWTTRLLLAVSMAADRVYALARPMKYKMIPHKKYQSIAYYLHDPRLGYERVDLVYFERRMEFGRGNLPVLLERWIYFEFPSQIFIDNASDQVWLFWSLVIQRLFACLFRIRKPCRIRPLAKMKNEKYEEKPTRRWSFSYVWLNRFWPSSMSVGCYVFYYACLEFMSLENLNCFVNTLLTLLLKITIKLYMVMLISKPFRKMIFDQLQFGKWAKT